MKLKTTPFLFLMSVAIALTSCTEAFKEKMKSAENYLGEMKADNVVVGTATKTQNGERMSMTTVKFSGVSSSFSDLELEQKANKFAWDFYTSLSSEYFKDETHIEVTLITDGDIEYQYTIPLEALNHVSEYMEKTEAMMLACTENDTATIDGLKDDNYMPDDQMYIIYDYTSFDDSLYSGTETEHELTGFRITQGADDPDLKLFSATYEFGNPYFKTDYTVNIDRESKKVVYIWLKTDAR